MKKFKFYYDKYILMITMSVHFYRDKNMDKKVQRRIIRNFVDLLILFEIYRSPLISGYDIIIAFQRKFNLIISPGTIYLTLYRLERDGLIKGENRRRKRVYILTRKGEKIVKNIPALKENINFILSRIW